MSGTKESEEIGRKFGNETHDNCDDDARTEQNRAGSPKTDGAQDNVHQRARDNASDEAPKRDSGASK